MQGMHRGEGFGERSGRGLKQMVEDMTDNVTGLRLENK